MMKVGIALIAVLVIAFIIHTAFKAGMKHYKKIKKNK